jgi:hypothetical protein
VLDIIYFSNAVIVDLDAFLIHVSPIEFQKYNLLLEEPCVATR